MHMTETFSLEAPFAPSGDQPQAIARLLESIRDGNRYQTLLGVTGSGKTFTMANLIARLGRPTLILSHNKTLAAQLYSEFRAFFPHNAVEYFVSYFDYYQPEAYLPATDTYIEKDSSINDEIERLRMSAASSLLSRRDVIVVASVSCIYGLASPEDFLAMMLPLKVGDRMGRDVLVARLAENLYERNDIRFERSKFRVRGDTVDIFPSYMETAIRVEFFGDEIERIRELDPLTGRAGSDFRQFLLYPAKQFVTPEDRRQAAIQAIREELAERIAWFQKENRLLEAQRISQRTEYDLEMLQEVGFCNGIENYSRHLTGRAAGEPPFTILDFFPKDSLLIIDESHVTWPQIGGMYHGDRSRKEKLVDYGFRLPSALDNRPLKPDEFTASTWQTVFVSATPAPYERNVSCVVAEQIMRPTGLLDPLMEVRPTKGQVEDSIAEARKAAAAGERVLVTTLTKRMSEDLSSYMRERGVRVEYLHSDIDALQRVEILRRLRRGEFDVLVGINLLREGLDLPEVALVLILDADKEGFLRNETSLIQTAGRAARHENGRVILYADVMTDSIKGTLAKTADRRSRQMAWNAEHGIVPRSVKRGEQASLTHAEGAKDEAVMHIAEDDEAGAVILELEQEMLDAAEALQFERAAVLRDQIDTLRKRYGHATAAPAALAAPKSGRRSGKPRK